MYLYCLFCYNISIDTSITVWGRDTLAYFNHQQGKGKAQIFIFFGISVF